MADINDKVVTDSVLKKAITEVLQVVAENTFNFVEYESDEVNALFDGTPEQISYYESIINDSLTSENRLWSSKKIADEVAKAIIDSNAYADGLITNISSIELKYTDALPSTGNANTIYILKSTTSDPDTLNLYNDGSWIKIGDFNINLDDYATTDYVNTKLADKANSSEVLAVNKVQTTTGSETNDSVYSSKLTKDELDKKINVTDFDTHKNDTVAHITSDERTKWNDAADMVKVDGDVLDYIKNNPKKNLTIYWDTTNTNTPYTAGFTESGGGTLISNIFDKNWGSVIGTCGGDFLCINRLMGGTWRGWEKLYTTKVADVPLTNVPIPDGLFETINTSASYIKYEVVNGIAFVYINIRDAKIIANGISRNITVPKMKNPFNYTTIGENFNNALTFMLHGNNMQIWSLGNTAAATSYGCCISYPVAE